MKTVVWLGPMGKDEASKRAMEIAQYYLADACKDFGLDFYFPALLGGENWLTRLLEEIRGAAGVVCDISGERCNVYYELGYAHALKIPTMILCRSGTDVPVDLKNIQHNFYDTISDVQGVMKKWLTQLNANQNILSDALRSLPHKFSIIEGDGHHEYVYNFRLHRRPFKFEEIDSPLTLQSISQTQPEIGALLSQIHALQEEIAKRTFRPFFAGDLLGFINHVPQRDSAGGLFGANIGVRRTDYHTFVATHYPAPAVQQARELSIIDSETASSLLRQLATQMNSSSWPLALPLTAMVFVIVESNGEKWLFFQQRNTAKNFHATYTKQATAGGMIHPTRILNADGGSELSPETALLQELCEETGIRVPLERVRLLGLVKEEQWNEYGFVGYVMADTSELYDRKLPIDSFESDAFDPVRLQPKAVTEYLRNQASGGKDLTPLTLAALALLMTHEFGVRTMREIFEGASS